MNDEDKARIRERLGLRYFEILLQGMCPYCGRELVHGSDARVAELAKNVPAEMLAGCLACVPCMSIWNKPEFGGDPVVDDPVERMRRTWRPTSKKGRH